MVALTTSLPETPSLAKANAVYLIDNDLSENLRRKFSDVRLLKLSDNEVWNVAQSRGTWRINTSPSVITKLANVFHLTVA
jgi:hypothetical protein